MVKRKEGRVDVGRNGKLEEVNVMRRKGGREGGKENTHRPAEKALTTYP